MIDKHWSRWDEHDCEAAYEEIERLQAEIEARKTAAEKVYLEQAADNERLRTALQDITTAFEFTLPPDSEAAWKIAAKARRALGPKP